MKRLRASFFSLMIKNSTFSYCCTGLGAGCSTKEAIDSFFRNQFKLYLENTRCIDFHCAVAKLSQQRCFIQSAYYARLSSVCSTKQATDGIIFQSHATKFDQKQYFRLRFCYTFLYARWPAKEAIGNFFFKALYEKSKKRCSVIFRFIIQN